MSVQAFLSLLGRSLPERDLYAGRAAWRAACEQEEELLRTLERRLSAPGDGPLRLVGTPLDGGEPAAGDPSDLLLGETVGGSDGLAPLQGFVLAALLEVRSPPELRYDDPYIPLRLAREGGFDGPLAAFRHLLDHDPLDGYYLPLDFPDPVSLPGALREQAGELSFGSAHHLEQELERWVELSRTSETPAPDWLRAHCQNLALVNRAALRTRLALAIA
jgi:hypothetical protein